VDSVFVAAPCVVVEAAPSVALSKQLASDEDARIAARVCLSLSPSFACLFFHDVMPW
jgi:hypothetical protein